MIKKRWARVALLVCVCSGLVTLVALPATAVAKRKTKTVNRCVNAALAIPDGPASGTTAVNPVATFSVRVHVPKFRGKAQNGVVTGFNSVGVRISHTDDGDLALFLVSPGGRAIALSTYRDQSADQSGDGYGAGPLNCSGSLVQFGDVFPTSITTPGNNGPGAPITGSFRPDQPLNTFIGGPARGFWTLIVQDVQNQDVGQINGLSLSLTYRYKARKKRR